MDDAEVRERCVDGCVRVLGESEVHVLNSSVRDRRAGRREIIREIVEPQACGP